MSPVRRPRGRGGSPDPAALQDALGHHFADPALLERALTHVSAVADGPRAKGAGGPRLGSYQRLEFLGDRVLGLAVAEALHAAYPKADEGELSRRLADLVRAETCAEVAEAWNLGAHLRLGGGEARSGGRRRGALLADAMEAVVGAVFLDGGWDAAQGVVGRAIADRLAAPSGPSRDPKTHLQEWAQGLGKPPPAYELAERAGPDHAPRFVIAVTVEGHGRATGEGGSKREAEQAAATAFLDGAGLGGAGKEKAA